MKQMYESVFTEFVQYENFFRTLTFYICAAEHYNIVIRQCDKSVAD
jgi:hypothetical protein